MADEGIISVRFANLYRYPAIDGNVTACLCKGTEVQILDIVGQFYRIRFGNDESYIPIRCIRTERRNDGAD